MYLSEFSLGSPSSLQKATKCIKSINFVFSGRNRRYAGPTSFCITWTVCCNTKKNTIGPHQSKKSRPRSAKIYSWNRFFSSKNQKILHPTLSDSFLHVFVGIRFLHFGCNFVICNKACFENACNVDVQWNKVELRKKGLCCQIFSSACSGKVCIHKFLLDLDRHIEKCSAISSKNQMKWRNHAKVSAATLARLNFSTSSSTENVWAVWRVACASSHRTIDFDHLWPVFCMAEINRQTWTKMVGFQTLP